MDNRRETEWQKALEQGLNREADHLSVAVQLRLQQARQQALLELNSQHLAKSKLAWLRGFIARFDAKPSAVFAGLVGAMVLTMGIQLAMNHWAEQSLTNLEVMPNNSADVLMSNEDIEFLENMDIYEWLAAEYS
jgi:hypothetical protein